MASKDNRPKDAANPPPGSGEDLRRKAEALAREMADGTPQDIAAREALEESESTIGNALGTIAEPDADTGTPNLGDIIDSEELQSLMENFHKITQIGGAILDISGNVLVGVAWKDICTKFHRAHPETAKNCLESDLALAKGLPAGTFKAYRCKNNMWDMVSPIKVGEKHLGNIYIGQFFYEDEDVDRELFEKQARRYGFDETEYLAALDRVPRLKRETVESAMTFYAKLAGMISSLSYGKIKLSRYIDQRKQAEEALRESETRFQKMLGAVPDMISIQNPEMDILYSNWHGFAAVPDNRRILHTKCHKTYRGFDDICPDCLATSVLEFRQPVHEETRLPDGKWYDIRVIPILDKDNNVEMFMEWVRDITEGKQAEEALRSNYALLQIAGETARFGGWSVDLEKNIATWSDAVADIHEMPHGYAPSVQDAIHFYVPEWRDQITRVFNDCAQKGIPFDEEMEIITSKGKRVWVRTNGRAVTGENGKIIKVQGAFQDITERKRIEQKMIEQKDLLGAIYRNAPLVIMVVNAERRIQQINGFPAQFAGRDAEEMLGLRGGEALRCLYAIDDPRGCGFGEFCRQCVIRNTVLDTLETGKTHLQVEAPYYFKGRDNETRELQFLMSTTPIRAKGQRMALVTLQDITERKRTEEALRKSEERFSLAMEATKDGIWDFDVTTGDIYCSPGLTSMLGYDSTDVIKHVDQWHNLIHPEDRQKAYQANLDCANNLTDSFQVEYRMKTKDGDWKWILGRGRAVYRDASGRARRMIGTHQDITERKQAETEKENLQSQLSQAQKMESVGRLAGGIAHDFNNMLGVILGRAEMAMDQVDPARPLFADLEEIRKAAERSANLTRQLLTFARKQTVAPKVVDLNETVEEALKMLRRLIGEDIDLAWLPGKNLAPVKMDPSQIDQILTNLCVNARDAIAGVGKITIETGVVSFDEAYCADHAGFIPGEFIMLAVSDNGCGMDPETIGHLFEPFFTTKAPGKGTGLGLASVYGAVKQNNGFINVYSEPGQGTTFRVYLPRRRAGSPLPAHKATAKPAARGSETILLVEDEPSILRMAATMLEKLGHVVIAAETPGEAIRLAHEHGDRIDLLMTDVVMPEMNGRALARNLLSIDPDIKCLFMSGYTANVIAHHGVLDEGVHFIQKPFSLKDLEAKLGEVFEDNNAD